METINKYSGIMISIRKIVRAINLESKRIEKDYGLSIPQLLTLKFLEEKTEYKSTMKDLKEHLSLNASTVSGIVARLESKGLIARLPNPNDKRSTPIILTSSGNKLIKQTDESLHERVMRKSNSLTWKNLCTPKDKAALTRITALKVAVRTRKCAFSRRNSKLCFLGWIG